MSHILAVIRITPSSGSEGQSLHTIQMGVFAMKCRLENIGEDVCADKFRTPPTGLPNPHHVRQLLTIPTVRNCHFQNLQPGHGQRSVGEADASANNAGARDAGARDTGARSVNGNIVADPASSMAFLFGVNIPGNGDTLLPLSGLRSALLRGFLTGARGTSQVGLNTGGFGMPAHFCSHQRLPRADTDT